MERWICNICGYIYDPSEGDPTQDIAPGTPFEELLYEWVCPECGASKDNFTRIDNSDY